MKNYILLTLTFLIFGCNEEKKENISFNNKITFESNLQEHTCWGSVSNQLNDIYVSYISKNIGECNIGKAKIILEKVIGRKNDGKAIFKKLDEIIVEKRNQNIAISKVYLKISPETKEQDYIVKFYDDRNEIITKIYAVWKIDYENMKFEKKNIPENMIFRNPDWME